MKTVLMLIIATSILVTKGFSQISGTQNYFGQKGMTNVFVRIIGQTAYVDVFYIEKMPRNYFGDTLQLTTNSEKIWRGRLCSLGRSRRKYFVYFNRQFGLAGSMNIKLAESEFTNQKIIALRNRTHFYSHILDVKNQFCGEDLDRGVEFWKIVADSKLLERTGVLSLREFEGEFKMFTQHLLE